MVLRADLSPERRLAELRAEAARAAARRKRCPRCQCTGGCPVSVLEGLDAEALTVVDVPGRPPRPEALMVGRCVPAGVVGLLTCSACL